MPELLQEMYYGPNVQNLIESDDCKVMRLSDNSGEGIGSFVIADRILFIKAVQFRNSCFKHKNASFIR